MSRRSLLGELAVLATASAVFTPEGSPAVGGPTPNPNAELIRLCQAHPAVLAALNDFGSGQDDCPLWLAYERSRDAIHAAVPVTLPGMVAKARAAKAEAVNPEDNTERPSGTPGEAWAWDLVNDLLRLECGA